MWIHNSNNSCMDLQSHNFIPTSNKYYNNFGRVFMPKISTKKRVQSTSIYTKTNNLKPNRLGMQGELIASNRIPIKSLLTQLGVHIASWKPHPRMSTLHIRLTWAHSEGAIFHRRWSSGLIDFLTFSLWLARVGRWHPPPRKRDPFKKWRQPPLRKLQ